METSASSKPGPRHRSTRAPLLNADVVQVLHGSHGPRAIFLGVVIGETASTSYLCEEVSRRLAGAPTPAGPAGTLRHSGTDAWQRFSLTSRP